MKGLEHLSYEERLGELGLSSLRNWQPKGISISKHMMGEKGEKAARFSSMVLTARKREKGWKKFHLKAKYFFYSVFKHLNTFTREVVESPSVEIFKTHLNLVLGNLLWLTLLQQWGWKRWSKELGIRKRQSSVFQRPLNIHTNLKRKVFSPVNFSVTDPFQTCPVKAVLKFKFLY